MTVFEVFAKSLFDRSLYRSVRAGEKLPFIGYLFFLAFVSAILFSIKPMISLFSDGQNSFHQFVSKAVDMYPKELEVEVKSGKVSVNVPQPYYYTLPFSEKRESNDKKYDLVIDTKTPFSAEKFNAYDTNSWLTEDAIFMRDSNGVEIKTYSLSEVPDTKVDKAVFGELMQKLTPYAKYVIPVVAWFMLMGIVFWRMGIFVYLLFYAIIGMIILRFFGKKIGYEMAYRLSAYACTLALVLEAIMTFVGVNVPFLFTASTTVALVAFVGLDSDEAKEKKATKK